MGAFRWSLKPRIKRLFKENIQLTFYIKNSVYKQREGNFIFQVNTKTLISWFRSVRLALQEQGWRPLVLFQKDKKNPVEICFGHSSYRRFSVVFFSSCLWWFHHQAEWVHHQSRLAQGVSAQQELHLAAGGAHAVPHHPALWRLRDWGERCEH